MNERQSTAIQKFVRTLVLMNADHVLDWLRDILIIFRVIKTHAKLCRIYSFSMQLSLSFSLSFSHTLFILIVLFGTHIKRECALVAYLRFIHKAQLLRAILEREKVVHITSTASGVHAGPRAATATFLFLRIYTLREKKGLCNILFNKYNMQPWFVGLYLLLYAILCTCCEFIMYTCVGQSLLISVYRMTLPVLSLFLSLRPHSTFYITTRECIYRTMHALFVWLTPVYFIFYFFIFFSLFFVLQYLFYLFTFFRQLPFYVCILVTTSYFAHVLIPLWLYLSLCAMYRKLVLLMAKRLAASLLLVISLLYVIMHFARKRLYSLMGKISTRTRSVICVLRCILSLHTRIYTGLCVSTCTRAILLCIYRLKFTMLKFSHGLYNYCALCIFSRVLKLGGFLCVCFCTPHADI